MRWRFVDLSYPRQAATTRLGRNKYNSNLSEGRFRGASNRGRFGPLKMSHPLETDCLKGVRRVGQIVGAFSSHGSWAICIRNLWTAHVHFCKIRRSLSPVASAGDCTQLTTLLLPAHAACPQQDCPLFVRHSKIVHATCDVVRGLWSLSEGSVRRDRRWNANGGSVGQFSNKRDRWVERRRRSSAKSSIMIIIWKSFLLFF